MCFKFKPYSTVATPGDDRTLDAGPLLQRGPCANGLALSGESQMPRPLRGHLAGNRGEMTTDLSRSRADAGLNATEAVRAAHQALLPTSSRRSV